MDAIRREFIIIITLELFVDFGRNFSRLELAIDVITKQESKMEFVTFFYIFLMTFNYILHRLYSIQIPHYLSIDYIVYRSLTTYRL